MKNISGYIIAVLGLIAAVFIVLYFHERNHECPQVANGTLPTLPPAAPLLNYKDSAGRSHVVLDRDAGEQIDREATTVANKVIGLVADSIGAGIKEKNIEGAMIVKLGASRDSIRFLRRTIDSLQHQVFTYQDEYLRLTMRAPAPGDTANNGDFDFAYNADLRFVDYWKRDKVLGLNVGKKRYFTDISSSDPRMTIKGVDKFTIQRTVPQFGFRIQALAAYNFETQGYSAGAGVRFDAGDRFNAGLNYTYSFTLNKWIPITYVKYDLLQFGR